MDKSHFTNAFFALLRETFEGSPAGQSSIYLDREIGVFSTLAKIDAETASRDVNSMTIAAQTEHTKFYLDRLVEFINGRTEKINWEDSWLIETVNETEWNYLRDGMRSSYEKVLQTIDSIEDFDNLKTGEALAILAHTAYHLGAIRQLLKAVVN
jgi:hypothetical protein